MYLIEFLCRFWFVAPRLQPNPYSEQGQRCQYYLDKLNKIPIGTLTNGAVLNNDITENCQIPSTIRTEMAGCLLIVHLIRLIVYPIAKRAKYRFNNGNSYKI